ncbi:MAG TPA: copper ion binding protein [Bacillota bacterium]
MSDQVMTFDVEGMSCNHCVNSIKNAVGALDGVKQVDVDLKGKKVTVGVSAGKTTAQAIREAIEDQGYEVK